MVIVEGNSSEAASTKSQRLPNALPEISAYISSVSKTGVVKVQFSDSLQSSANFTALVKEELKISLEAAGKGSKALTYWYCEEPPDATFSTLTIHLNFTDPLSIS